MKMEQLKYISEIANTGSINKAAANLFISQPNLSREIKALETELGCDLIERNSRGVSLTPAGKKFVEYAEPVLSQFEHLKMVSNPSVTDADYYLSLATARFHFIPIAVAEIINHYKSASRRIRVNVLETDRDGVLDNVSDGIAGIGFISIPDCYSKELTSKIRSKELTFSLVSMDHVCVCVGKQNPLYNREEDWVSVEELADFPMICFQNRDYYHYSDVERLIGIPASKDRFSVNTYGMQLDLLHTTDAYCVFSSSNDARDKNFGVYDDVRKFNVRGCTLTTRTGWVYRSDKELTPAEKEFMELVARKSM